MMSTSTTPLQSNSNFVSRIPRTAGGNSASSAARFAPRTLLTNTGMQKQR
uniref:Uncharacterized protein n=1 Tax=Plectus sambesii TaxID=2011161 RepID=A0A914VXA5_9BILA